MSERMTVTPDLEGIACAVCEVELEVGAEIGTTIEGVVDDIPVIMPTCIEHEGQEPSVTPPREVFVVLEVIAERLREEGHL